MPDISPRHKSHLRVEIFLNIAEIRPDFGMLGLDTSVDLTSHVLTRHSFGLSLSQRAGCLHCLAGLKPQVNSQSLIFSFILPRSFIEEYYPGCRSARNVALQTEDLEVS